MSVLLTLQGLYRTEMGAIATSSNVQTQLRNVQVGALDYETGSEITKSALNDFKLLPVDFQGDVGGFTFNPDAFTPPFTARFNVSTTNSSIYPDAPSFAEMYPAGNITPIGPLVTLEVPYSALRRNADPAQKTIVVSPVLYKQFQSAYEPTDSLGVEVRVLRPDGSEDFLLEDYIAGGRIVILAETLDAAFAGGIPPETLTISFQPVEQNRFR